MRGAQLFCLLGAMTLGFGCGGDGKPELEEKPTVAGDDNLARPRPVIVQGCLTASGDRFVLTDLESGARGPAAEREASPPAAEGEPTTESYRLVGADDDLRAHVGQRVEITGESEPEQVVEVQETSPPAAPGNETAGTSGAAPKVSTVQRTRLEISDLQVRSVKALGDRCDSQSGRR